MNLKGITAPLADKMTVLVEVLTDLLENVKEQTEIQKKILIKLNEKDTGEA